MVLCLCYTYIRYVQKIPREKFLLKKHLMLFIVLLYQIKLEIIFSTLIYDLSRYLKPIINNTRSNLDVLYKIVKYIKSPTFSILFWTK